MSVIACEPRELVFLNVQRNVVQTLPFTITNTIDSPVTFSLKSSNPQRYRLSRENGIQLQPNQALDITITLQYQYPGQPPRGGRRPGVQKDQLFIRSTFFEQRIPIQLFLAGTTSPLGPSRSPSPQPRSPTRPLTQSASPRPSRRLNTTSTISTSASLPEQQPPLPLPPSPSSTLVTEDKQALHPPKTTDSMKEGLDATSRGSRGGYQTPSPSPPPSSHSLEVQALVEEEKRKITHRLTEDFNSKCEKYFVIFREKDAIIRDKEQAIERLREELLAAHERQGQLEAAAVQEHGRFQELEELIKQREEQIQGLNTELAEWRDKEAKHQGRDWERSEKLREVQEENDRLRESCHLLKQQVDRLEEEAVNKDGIIMRMAEDLRSQARLADQSLALQLARDNIADQKEQIDVLVAELARLRQEVQDRQQLPTPPPPLEGKGGEVASGGGGAAPDTPVPELVKLAEESMTMPEANEEGDSELILQYKSRLRDMEEHLKATQDELRRSQDGEAALRERDAVLTERVKALENLQASAKRAVMLTEAKLSETNAQLERRKSRERKLCACLQKDGPASCPQAQAWWLKLVQALRSEPAIQQSDGDAENEGSSEAGDGNANDNPTWLKGKVQELTGLLQDSGLEVARLRQEALAQSIESREALDDANERLMAAGRRISSLEKSIKMIKDDQSLKLRELETSLKIVGGRSDLHAALACTRQELTAEKMSSVYLRGELELTQKLLKEEEERSASYKANVDSLQLALDTYKVSQSIQGVPGVSPLALIEHFAGSSRLQMLQIQELTTRLGLARSSPSPNRRSRTGGMKKEKSRDRPGIGGTVFHQQEGVHFEDQSLTKRWIQEVEVLQLLEREKRLEEDLLEAREEMLRLKLEAAGAQDALRREKDALEEAQRVVVAGLERQLDLSRAEARRMKEEVEASRNEVILLEKELRNQRLGATSINEPTRRSPLRHTSRSPSPSKESKCPTVSAAEVRRLRNTLEERTFQVGVLMETVETLQAAVTASKEHHHVRRGNTETPVSQGAGYSQAEDLEEDEEEEEDVLLEEDQVVLSRVSKEGRRGRPAESKMPSNSPAPTPSALGQCWALPKLVKRVVALTVEVTNASALSSMMERRAERHAEEMKALQSAKAALEVNLTEAQVQKRKYHVRYQSLAEEHRRILGARDRQVGDLMDQLSDLRRQLAECEGALEYAHEYNSDLEGRIRHLEAINITSRGPAAHPIPEPTLTLGAQGYEDTAPLDDHTEGFCPECGRLAPVDPSGKVCKPPGGNSGVAEEVKVPEAKPAIAYLELLREVLEKTQKWHIDSLPAGGSTVAAGVEDGNQADQQGKAWIEYFIETVAEIFVGADQAYVATLQRLRSLEWKLRNSQLDVLQEIRECNTAKRDRDVTRGRLEVCMQALLHRSDEKGSHAFEAITALEERNRHLFDALVLAEGKLTSSLADNKRLGVELQRLGERLQGVECEKAEMEARLGQLVVENEERIAKDLNERAQGLETMVKDWCKATLPQLLSQELLGESKLEEPPMALMEALSVSKAVNAGLHGRLEAAMKVIDSIRSQNNGLLALNQRKSDVEGQKEEAVPGGNKGGVTLEQGLTVLEGLGSQEAKKSFRTRFLSLEQEVFELRRALQKRDRLFRQYSLENEALKSTLEMSHEEVLSLQAIRRSELIRTREDTEKVMRAAHNRALKEQAEIRSVLEAEVDRLLKELQGAREAAAGASAASTSRKRSSTGTDADYPVGVHELEEQYERLVGRYAEAEAQCRVLEDEILVKDQAIMQLKESLARTATRLSSAGLRGSSATQEEGVHPSHRGDIYAVHRLVEELARCRMAEAAATRKLRTAMENEVKLRRALSAAEGREGTHQQLQDISDDEASHDPQLRAPGLVGPPLSQALRETAIVGAGPTSIYDKVARQAGIISYLELRLAEANSLLARANVLEEEDVIGGAGRLGLGDSSLAGFPFDAARSASTVDSGVEPLRAGRRQSSVNINAFDQAWVAASQRPSNQSVLREEISSLRTMVALERQEKESISARLAEAEKTIASLQDTIATLRAMPASNEQPALHEEISSLRTSLAVGLQKEEAASTRLAEAEKTIASLQETIASHRATIQELTDYNRTQSTTSAVSGDIQRPPSQPVLEHSSTGVQDEPLAKAESQTLDQSLRRQPLPIRSVEATGQCSTRQSSVSRSPSSLGMEELAMRVEDVSALLDNLKDAVSGDQGGATSQDMLQLSQTLHDMKEKIRALRDHGEQQSWEIEKAALEQQVLELREALAQQRSGHLEAMASLRSTYDGLVQEMQSATDVSNQEVERLRDVINTMRSREAETEGGEGGGKDIGDEAKSTSSSAHGGDKASSKGRRRKRHSKPTESSEEDVADQSAVPAALPSPAQVKGARRVPRTGKEKRRTKSSGSGSRPSTKSPVESSSMAQGTLEPDASELVKSMDQPPDTFNQVLSGLEEELKEMRTLYEEAKEEAESLRKRLQECEKHRQEEVKGWQEQVATLREEFHLLRERKGEMVTRLEQRLKVGQAALEQAKASRRNVGTKPEKGGASEAKGERDDSSWQPSVEEQDLLDVLAEKQGELARLDVELHQLRYDFQKACAERDAAIQTAMESRQRSQESQADGLGGVDPDGVRSDATLILAAALAESKLALAEQQVAELLRDLEDERRGADEARRELAARTLQTAQLRRQKAPPSSDALMKQLADLKKSSRMEANRLKNIIKRLQAPPPPTEQKFSKETVAGLQSELQAAKLDASRKARLLAAYKATRKADEKAVEQWKTEVAMLEERCKMLKEQVNRKATMLKEFKGRTKEGGGASGGGASQGIADINLVGSSGGSGQKLDQTWTEEKIRAVVAERDRLKTRVGVLGRKLTEQNVTLKELKERERACEELDERVNTLQAAVTRKDCLLKAAKTKLLAYSQELTELREAAAQWQIEAERHLKQLQRRSFLRVRPEEEQMESALTTELHELAMANPNSVHTSILNVLALLHSDSAPTLPGSDAELMGTMSGGGRQEERPRPEQHQPSPPRPPAPAPAPQAVQEEDQDLEADEPPTTSSMDPQQVDNLLQSIDDILALPRSGGGGQDRISALIDDLFGLEERTSGLVMGRRRPTPSS